MRAPLRFAFLLKNQCLLLLAPALLSCEDATENLFTKIQPVQLPVATHVGANTFGCLVSGELWEANHTKTLAGTVLTPKARYRHGVLRLDAFRRLQLAGPVTNFGLVATHVAGPGVYELGALAPHSASYSELKTANRSVGYRTDAGHVGMLTVTHLDTTGAHPFVVGRFELHAGTPPAASQPADFPAELRVTSGRFDIQLSHQHRRFYPKVHKPKVDARCRLQIYSNLSRTCGNSFYPECETTSAFRYAANPLVCGVNRASRPWVFATSFLAYYCLVVSTKCNAAHYL